MLTIKQTNKGTIDIRQTKTVDHFTNTTSHHLTAACSEWELTQIGGWVTMLALSAGGKYSTKSNESVCWLAHWGSEYQGMETWSEQISVWNTGLCFYLIIFYEYI